MAFPASGNHQSTSISNLCNSLTRKIDNALANNNVPASAPHIPRLVKKVYNHLKDASLRPAIGLLMISVKNALKNGWFHGTDADELLKMANELLTSFCMEASISVDANTAVNTISKIISRFLPQLILNHLIVCVEAKRGYDVLLADFYVDKLASPKENIRLFVARNDDLLASSCLISPSDASFLLNGKQVAGRTNIYLDSGPQVPTDVTEMVRYGANVIQAAGCFTDNYIVAVVSMGKSTATDVPNLKDYVQASVNEVASDSEILEGPSRISLNCPLSFKRMNIPIKGHLCKHLQCFDYNNYMELNCKKPSWHCPICNQNTSFVDLRIDQTMAKILRETTPDINGVIIYPDGKWSIADACNSSKDQMHNQVYNANSAANILDLTVDGDNTGDDINIKMEDEIHTVASENSVSLNSTTKSASSFEFNQELPSTVAVLDMFQSGSLFEPPVISNENEMQRLCSQRPDAILNSMQAPVPSQYRNMHHTQYRTDGYPCASYQAISSTTSMPQNPDSQNWNIRQQTKNQQTNISNPTPISSSTFLNSPEDASTDIRRRLVDQCNRLADHRGSSCSFPTSSTDVSRNESETSWQPSGRMRGSLTGTAYSAAVNRYSFQPPQ